MGVKFSLDTDTDTRKKFDAWASKNPNQSYLAATDGLVCAYYTEGESVAGFTDENNPPTTERLRNASETGKGSSITLPVIEGDYWEITGHASTVVWWLSTAVEVIK